LDEKGLRYLRNIEESAGLMGKLVDDLLAFSRMGRVEMATARVDLAQVVNEVRQELLPDYEDRNVAWAVGDLPATRGDASMLRQVFVNLLSNALKYTRPCEEAKIEIGSYVEANGTVVCFVRDNGVGFDMQYADKLFGVFQRLHRAEEFEGSGIGLASVQRVVARHGGRVWAEGVVDGGATFYFSLPNM
jgi:light-regulated signal transduction histidine kinase (bacteriophytochrome)